MIRSALLHSLATLLLLLAPPLAFAGSSTATTRSLSGDLTLDRAVQLALQQNPELLKALHAIEQTRGQVIEVRAQALPHLSSVGTYNQQDKALLESGGSGGSGGSFSGATTDSTTTGTDQASADAIAQSISDVFDQSQGGGRGINDKSWRVSMEVRQVLYAGGQVRAALRIARLTEDNSYWSLRDTVDQVISQTRTQFYNVLLYRSLITVAEESVQLQGDQLKDQKNRFEAGTVAKFNVLRAEVELANVKPNLIKAKNAYLIAQLTLAKLLGLEPAAGGKPAFNCVGELTVAERPLGLSNALAMARERRPFLKVQRQNILVEKEQIKVALAGYKPRLDANAGWEVRNSRLSDKLDDTVDGWFFGFTGRWEIFDGLATHGKVVQARAKLESAKVSYDDSVQQVELEVQQAYANLLQAKETIQSQQKNVEQALEALRLSRERLSAGAGTQLDVLDARVALTRARTTELEARADYNKALADFDRATATDTSYNEMFADPLAQKRTRKPRVPLKP